MARSRARHWATQVGRRARRARSAVEAPLRQLGRRLGQGAAVRLRLPGTRRVGPTRFARNGPVALANDVRGRGSPLGLIQGVGVGRWGWEPVADRLARRFQVITGPEVIALQALEQFVLYTGVRPTDDQVRRASEFSRA